MSRFLAAALALLFSLMVMGVTQTVNPGEVVLSGGCLIAAVLAVPVFLLSWGLEKLNMRYPRAMALGVAGLLCAIALHFGLIAFAILTAFTVLQFYLRRSEAFRLRHKTAGRRH